MILYPHTQRHMIIQIKYCHSFKILYLFHKYMYYTQCILIWQNKIIHVFRITQPYLNLLLKPRIVSDFLKKYNFMHFERKKYNFMHFERKKYNFMHFER